MTDLINKKCVPCAGGIPPLSEERENFYINQVEGWNLITEGIHRIQKKFYFEDFNDSMKFVNQVAIIAEQEDHHPDIHIYYDTVELEIHTHAIKGLHTNDFILAAKIDKI
ncbi:MAG: 4a-hydroxytetrahydrobiopterin dehydratase [Candidatus Thorarchaeota archaeon]